MEDAISLISNKFGKEFIFSRFREVKDAHMLAVRLDNIIINGKKIHARISPDSRELGFQKSTKNREEGGWSFRNIRRRILEKKKWVTVYERRNIFY